ncbi:MAG: L-serine ammonia-lyase, iron-sulfur-dependent, subunit alpha [Candidatus Muirbacterium halophilum]|nr:L-serine ammonia-lyase, iron-sulfur-dependent, subunit alpha [Candidatus Muirbacterium halophilum]
MFRDFFNDNLKIAYGCTEPIAVAWACSQIGKVLNKSDLSKLEITLDRNIFKNGFGAGIPGTNGKTGNLFAGALGYYIAEPDKNFSIFSDFDNIILNKAQKLIDNNIICINVDEKIAGIYIHVLAESTKNEKAEVIIRNDHLGLAKLIHNDKVLIEHSQNINNNLNSKDYISNMNIDDLIDFAENLSDSELDLTEKVYKTNFNASIFGIENPSGLKLGYTLNKLWNNEEICHSVENYIKIHTAAACDARMGGENVPVMTLCGSGNQGIAASLPIYCYYKYKNMDNDRRLKKAMAISFLITAYIKKRLGKLSPICGCVVASGSGATSGIAYLENYPIEIIKNSISNLIGDVTGVICDGAKGSCTLKLATAVSAASYYGLIAKNGCNVNEYNGIIGKTIEETVENLKKVSSNGMKQVDNEIVNIFLDKLKSGLKK